MTRTLLLCTVFAALFLAVPTLAQDRLSLTTDSEAAKTDFRAALDHLNNVEFAAARDASDAALKKDPDFALALMVRGVTSETFSDGTAYVNKGKALRSEVTPGERH